MAAFTIDDVKAVRKPRDSWWTVYLVDPAACRLTLFIANHTRITPNGVTRLSILLGLASAGCFAAGWLAAGAGRRRHPARTSSPAGSPRRSGSSARRAAEPAGR